MNDLSPIRTIDTGTMPVNRRVRGFEEAYADFLFPCFVESLTDAFTTHVAAMQFGMVGIAKVRGTACNIGTEAGATHRNPPLLMMEIVTRGHGHVTMEGRRTEVRAGDALVISAREPWWCSSQADYESISIVVPDAALAGHLTDVGAIRGHIARGSPETDIIQSYLSALRFSELTDTPELRGMVGSHVLNLMTTALARGLGVEDPTGGRGTRDVRAAQVMRLIARSLGDPMLGAASIARRMGLTDRYVHKIFETTGTTCAAYIQEQRLQAVHRRLTDPASASQRIRDIVEAAGFSDVSHFNRLFRRRFGETPTAVRHPGSGRRVGPAGDDGAAARG